MQDAIDEVVVDTASVSSDLGDISQLATPVTTDLVAGVNSHSAETMPHQFVDGATTYRYGFAVDSGGFKFVYEEVV